MNSILNLLYDSRVLSAHSARFLTRTLTGTAGTAQIPSLPGTALLLYPAREHYIVYEPFAPRLVAIVAAIRQGRDIPAILQKWAAPIRRELAEVRGKIERSEIRVPSRNAPRSRRKK